MLVTVNSRSRAGQRRRTIKRQGVAVGPLALRFVTIFVLALLTLIYLIQSTKGSTKQIEISRSEDKMEILKNQREDIQIEAIRLKSMQNLKNSPVIQDYEQVIDFEDLSKN